jgi:hypothetical protein
MLSLYCICITNAPGHSLFRMSARSARSCLYMALSIVRICKHKYTKLYQASDF